MFQKRKKLSTNVVLSQLFSQFGSLIGRHSWIIGLLNIWKDSVAFLLATAPFFHHKTGGKNDQWMIFKFNQIIQFFFLFTNKSNNFPLVAEMIIRSGWKWPGRS